MIKMSSVKCFVCNSDKDVNTLLTTKSKHSGSPLIELLKKCLKQHYLKSMKHSIVCRPCVDKFDEYDLALMTSLRIEEEFCNNLIKNTAKNDVEDTSVLKESKSIAQSIFSTELDNKILPNQIENFDESECESVVDTYPRDQLISETVNTDLHDIEEGIIFHNYSNKMIMKLEKDDEDDIKKSKINISKISFKCKYCISNFGMQSELAVSLKFN